VPEQWEYVDPSAYSDPYAEAPVYTSGDPAAPTAAPPSMRPQAYAQAESPQGYGFPAAAGQGVGAPPPGDAMLSPDYRPEAGELAIKERRTWKSWQLLTAVVVAMVVGMWLYYIAGPVQKTDAASAASGYKLPPPSSGAGGTTTTAAGAAAGATTTTAAGATTTTAAGATTTTAATAAGAAGTSTSSTVAVGPATVLVPEQQLSGNWTSPAFTIAGGTWNVGWAFQCTPAPSATPTFEIFVVTSGSAPSGTPAITSSAASGSAVTPLTTTGSQQVVVQTTAACRWAVKVTGSGS
jgi:hypothetical protein